MRYQNQQALVYNIVWAAEPEDIDLAVDPATADTQLPALLNLPAATLVPLREEWDDDDDLLQLILDELSDEYDFLIASLEYRLVEGGDDQ